MKFNSMVNPFILFWENCQKKKEKAFKYCGLNLAVAKTATGKPLFKASDGD